VEGKDNNNHFITKIIDFGTAKIFEKNKIESKLTGSCYYIAPEVLNKKYNQKCDVWSTGVILYILLCSQPPFHGKQDDETFDKIKNQPLNFNHKNWGKVSQEAKDLIKKMLDKNPETRFSAEEAILHSWFTKHKKKEGISKERFTTFIGNLKNYRPDYKLQQAALAIIVHNLPHNEDIKELERAFRMIDENKDGKLSREELIKGFKFVFKKTEQETIREVDAIFKNVDNDNNGYIEYEEFIRACIDKNKLINDENLRLAFNFFDLDSSGQITVKNLKEVFGGGGDLIVSSNIIRGIMGDIDLDGDGQISYDEFRKMMKKILV